MSSNRCDYSNLEKYSNLKFHAFLSQLKSVKCNKERGIRLSKNLKFNLSNIEA